jgi:hypothetical protein
MSTVLLHFGIPIQHDPYFHKTFTPTVLSSYIPQSINPSRNDLGWGLCHYLELLCYRGHAHTMCKSPYKAQRIVANLI